MNDYPSRGAAIRLHRMTAAQHKLMIGGDLERPAGAFHKQEAVA